MQTFLKNLGPMLFLLLLIGIAVSIYQADREASRAPVFDYTINIHNQSGELSSTLVQTGKTSYEGIYWNGMMWFKVSGCKEIVAPVGWKISATKVKHAK